MTEKLWNYMKDIDFFTKGPSSIFPILYMLAGSVFILYILIVIRGLSEEDRSNLLKELDKHTPIAQLLQKVFLKGQRGLTENGSIILAVILILMIFSYAFYRYIPAYLFGGQLKKVEIILEEDNNNLNDCDLYLIDSQPSTLFLFKKCGDKSQTTEISRTSVKQIIYTNEENEKDPI